MVAELGEDGVEVAGVDGVAQPVVAVHALLRRRGDGLAAQVHRHVELQPDQHRLVGAQQLAVAAQRDHGDVERAVRVGLLGGSPRARPRSHLPRAPRAARRWTGGRRNESALDGVPLQDVAHLVQLVDVARRQLRDPHAAPRHVLDEALLGRAAAAPRAAARG